MRFELTTIRLTAEGSAAELTGLDNIAKLRRRQAGMQPMSLQTQCYVAKGTRFHGGGEET